MTKLKGAIAKALSSTFSFLKKSLKKGKKQEASVPQPSNLKSMDKVLWEQTEKEKVQYVNHNQI